MLVDPGHQFIRLCLVHLCQDCFVLPKDFYFVISVQTFENDLIHLLPGLDNSGHFIALNSKGFIIFSRLVDYSIVLEVS
jgi:hypothetical protein